MTDFDRLIEAMYVEARMSLREIVDATSDFPGEPRRPRTQNGIGKRLKRNGVKLRPRGPYFGQQKVSNADLERTVKLYEGGLSEREVGEYLGIHQTSVNYRLDLCGVERRSRSEATRLAYLKGSRIPAGAALAA